jgi:membrane protein implicated in regulation of membrane protease activity
MKLRTGSKAAVFARYLLFQVPGCVAAAAVLAALVHWEHLSPTLGYVLFGIWVLGEIALFPVLRIGYEPGGMRGGAEALVGTLGVAQEDLDPEGYVRMGAERWLAVVASGCAPVAAGARVRVRELRQLTLVVEPVDAAPPQEAGAVDLPQAS